MHDMCFKKKSIKKAKALVLAFLKTEKPDALRKLNHESRKAIS